MKILDKWFSRYFVWVLLIWTLWLTIEYWAFGKSSFVRLHNVADSSLPQLLALRGNVANHLFGNWQPQWGCGSDRASVPISYNIAALFFLIFPGSLAYPAFTIAQRFLAAIFSYKLLKEQCGVEAIAAIPAAMWYSMFSQQFWNRGWSGFTTYDGLGLPAIPLILYALSKLELNRKRDYVIALLAGFLGGVSAHIAFTFGIIPVVVIWFYAVDPKRTSRFWYLLILCFASWTLTIIPLSWPSLLLFPDSVRAEYQLAPVFGGTFSHVIGLTTVLRDNLVPLSLMLTGLAATRFKRSQLLMVAIAACALEAAILIYACAGAVLGSRFPKLAAFSVDRVGSGFPWLFCAGMAFSIHMLSTAFVGNVKGVDTQREYTFAPGHIFAFVLAAVVLWQSAEMKITTLREMIDGHNQKNYYMNPALLALTPPKQGLIPERVATISVGPNVLPLIPPGAVWANGFESADSSLVLQSNRYRQFWTQVIGPQLSRDEALSNWVRLFGQQLNLFHGEAAGGAVNLDDEFNLNLLSLANVRYIFSPLPVQSTSLRPVQNAYLSEQLHTASLNRPNRLLQILRGRYNGMPVYLYENPDTLPRVFWVRNLDRTLSPEQLLKKIGSAQLSQLHSTAFVPTNDTAYATDLDTTRRISVTKYTSDEIDISVSKGHLGFLVITNNYSKFWKAECDSKNLVIVPTDYTFQGVQVPPECVNLRFEYDRPGV